MEKYSCINKIFSTSVFLCIGLISMAQSIKGFAIDEKTDQKQIDILYNNKVLTSFLYSDSIKKPVLFPVNSLNGITVTRSYPIHKISGERTDHPHHTGIWLNYESVNGLDFWNNSNAIPLERRHRYGTILHNEVLYHMAKKIMLPLPPLPVG
jgi:hypothetical protein